MNVLRESSILDGILQTITKKVTKLCPAHLLPDSIPPAPQSTMDEDNAELLPTILQPSSPVQDVLPTIPPVDVLQPSPSVHHPLLQAE